MVRKTGVDPILARKQQANPGQFAAAIGDHAQSEDFWDGLEPADLVMLLRNALAGDGVGPIEVFVVFVRRLLESMNNEGAGERFPARPEFVSAIGLATDRLTRAGAPISDIWLEKAEYHALMENARKARRACITKAIRSSRTADDRARALLVQAQYRIDTSRYRAARRSLDRCEAAIDGPPSGLQALAAARRGITYFYQEHNQALAAFDRAIEIASLSTPSRETHRALAESHHFSGRIDAARGDFASALNKLIAGQDHKQRITAERKRLAFYHLRLGEVLLTAGTLDHAKDHFDAAHNLFTQTQDTGGHALLGGLRATLHLKNGNPAQARSALTAAVATAHKTGYPRHQLVCRKDLLVFQLSRREWAGATATALAALWVVVRGGRESLTMIPVFLKSGASFLHRPPHITPAPQPILCPCPDHPSAPRN